MAKEEDVEVNKDMVKILSADTRVKILKELKDKDKTPSSLSRLLNKNKATVVEHLSILSNAGLVDRIQRPGRKWVFYSLTNRGKRIVSPYTTRVLTLFSISILTLFFGLFGYHQSAGGIFGAQVAETALTEAAKAPLNEAVAPILTPPSPFLYISIGLISISIITMILAIRYKLKEVKL